MRDGFDQFFLSDSIFQRLPEMKPQLVQGNQRRYGYKAAITF